MHVTYLSIGHKWLGTRKNWQNRGQRGGKPSLVAYFIDENGKFGCKKITKLKSLIIKGQIYKRKTFQCLDCGFKGVYLIKKDTDVIPCSNCGDDSELS